MKKLIVLSMVAVLGSAGLSLAQTGGSIESGNRADAASSPMNRHAKWLSKVDTDGDGEVSDAERTAFHDAMRQKFFEKKDENGNGTLERSEVERMSDDEFAKLDKDKSGGLSMEEMPTRIGHHRGRHRHRGHHGRMAKHMFKRVDGNGDGKVTREEMRSASDAFFAKLDTDKSGTITEGELKSHHGKGKGCHAKGKTQQQ